MGKKNMKSINQEICHSTGLRSKHVPDLPHFTFLPDGTSIPIQNECFVTVFFCVDCGICFLFNLSWRDSIPLYWFQIATLLRDKNGYFSIL